MNNYSIERDLLKILKSKTEDELFYTLLNMANGTYQYEIPYLNNVPLNELLIHLEKIILITTKRRHYNDDEILDIVMDFCERVDKVRYRDLTKNKVMNMRYAAKLKLARLNVDKKVAVKIASIVLTSIAVLNLFNEMTVLGKNSELVNEEIEIVSELDMSEENKQVIYEFESSLVHFSSKPPQKEELKEIVVEEEKELTNEEKVSIILEKYKLTAEEFDILCAITLREAAALSYDDAYAVINTVYNRTLSKLFHIDCEKFFGKDAGYSLYYQAIMPGQFVVYEEGYYKEKLGVKDEPGYQAIIDFLYTEETKHDFLQFRANFCEVSDSTQFVADGNKYFDPIELEERLDYEITR